MDFEWEKSSNDWKIAYIIYRVNVAVENQWFPVQKMIYKWWISPTNTGIYWEYHGNIMGYNIMGYPLVMTNSLPWKDPPCY